MENDLSVLMSVYNGEKPDNLDESMESILRQTVLPSYFILVIDGYISDELDIVIQNKYLKFEKKNISLKIVRLKKNQGLTIALNAGLNECKTKYVARMDSDDISNKSRFEKQMEKLLENKELDIIGSDVSEFVSDNGKKKEINYKTMPSSNGDILAYSKLRNPFCHPTVIFKRDMVKSVGNYEECHYFEDYYLWIRLFKHRCIGMNINEPLVAMRVDEGLYLRRSGLSYVKDIFNFRRKALQIGYQNFFEFLYTIILQGMVAIVPSQLRELVYNKLLRKKI
ncbi:glycosyltransferase [Dellaglioa carnosa]|uniref:Glycosyltransferase n=1 Tax=Dellaglioa carnosa TaxID=2995136 RepID=A0ABT4JMJ8_9LACO|nr:glycosyltransferase [Dellaglioa carnosa]MCZ2491589.1 glycosyltransferase [Dellaglioa carnosa]MCZ2494666.1 glycosyltransferase [Dellaglioa carnosa]MDK1731529.1 glycosyltransferase [Dellaglioa carnosa]